jgi:tetratricopeptide (TPR) repeat protein
VKLKPIYIYLSLFAIFVATVIFFTNDSKKNAPSDETRQMPNDEIHSKSNSGDQPSRSNVTKEAIENMNRLREAFEKNPDDTVKVREYADLLTVHQPEEALKLYTRIYNIDPKRIDILFQLTLVYFKKGDFDRSEEFNNRILSLQKNNMLAYYNTGAIAEAKGNRTKARLIWQEIASKHSREEIGRIAMESIKQLDRKK